MKMMLGGRESALEILEEDNVAQAAAPAILRKVLLGSIVSLF